MIVGAGIEVPDGLVAEVGLPNPEEPISEVGPFVPEPMAEV